MAALFPLERVVATPGALAQPHDAALAERAGDQLGVSVFAGNTR